VPSVSADFWSDASNSSSPLTNKKNQSLNSFEEDKKYLLKKKLNLKKRLKLSGKKKC
jgi:hypothetical protein